MRFLGGEAPGSRALGSGALHVALMALFGVLISAFMLYATVAWAQTAEEADTAEGAEAAQSEAEPDADAASEEADEEAAGESSKEDEGSGDGASDEEIRLEGKPAEDDEDSEQIMKTPEEAAEDEAQDEMAEKISEAEDIEALASGELAGEVAFARDGDGDGEADRVVIPRGDCVVRQGASVTLREDAQYGGDRFTLTDNRNVQITSNNRQIQIVSDSRTNDDIRSDNGRTLDPGSYDVVSSRGIVCTDDDDDNDDNGDGRDRDPRVGIIYVIERTSALPDTGGEAGGDTLTTAANGERASTPASVLFSVLSIVGFTGLLFFRRMRGYIR